MPVITQTSAPESDPKALDVAPGHGWVVVDISPTGTGSSHPSSAFGDVMASEQSVGLFVEALDSGRTKKIEWPIPD